MRCVICIRHMYPISEERSSGLIQFCNNLAGIPLTFIVQAMVSRMEIEKWGVIFVVCVSGSMIVLFVNVSYKRLAAESIHRDL